MTQSRFDTGSSIRRDVLGADYVERQLARDDPFNAPLQQWFTEAIWADIWERDDLPRSQRSLIVIAFLLALGRYEELKLHYRGALKNGCTLPEIREVILQGAAYCGGPAALAAARAANEALAEEIAAFAKAAGAAS